MTDPDPTVPVDWHDALRASEPPERVDHVERRLGLTAARCWDDEEQWRRFALRRIERLTRRIMHALSEPLSDEDAIAEAAMADLRRIRQTLNRIIADYAKLMKGRTDAGGLSLFPPGTFVRRKRTLT